MTKHYWNVQHIRDGKVIWEGNHLKNALANQGAEAILEYFYRGNVAFAPGQFYVRLCNYSPVVTDTLSTIQNEPGGNGYAPQLLPASTIGFPTKGIAADGNVSITSVAVTFTASGGQIGPVTSAFIATSSNSSGKLISYLPLTITRTILNGDSMTYSFSVEEGN
jgi:hypothetical protein